MNEQRIVPEKVGKRREQMLIKFDEKEYWCKLLNVSNISQKP